nr:MAG: hypothetical protein [Gammatorquevirus sp.]
MSPWSLRKKFIPTRGRKNTRSTHPAAAAAAGATQVQHPPALNRPERKTETTTTTHRNVTLTRFKIGFEQDTEREMSIAFCRPPRTYKEDPPFYPWLPKLEPLVNFHLNFKG